MDPFHLMNLVFYSVRNELIKLLGFQGGGWSIELFPNFNILFSTDIFFPNSTTSKQLVEQKKKQSFEEMDKDNDKIIVANEFDRDLE